jgi:acetyl esterase/lipase
MRASSFAAIGLATAIGLGTPVAASAQTDDTAAAFVRVSSGYGLTPDITYHRAGGQDLTLDVYRPRAASEPNPTLIYIHGGGWTNGSRQASALTFLPYLEMGWSVVNVSYRLADAAHAPAAVEDCRCALRWVYRNAEQFNFDIDRIVVTGNSAGGHLSLTTGMLPASAGLDRQCPGDRRRAWTTGATSMAELKVAAIINWYGITDVHDLAQRPAGASGNFTEAWLGSRSDRDAVARRVSPTNYVNGDTPPILTIHGAADPIVPYDQATRLHELLDEWDVPNQLITVEGGGHGGFSPEENQRIYTAIRAFLGEHGLGAETSND